MKKLIIAGKEFDSRLFLGTGKFHSNATMEEAILASGCEMVTVAMKRIELDDKEDDMLKHIIHPHIRLLPNTSGVRTAEEAVFAEPKQPRVPADPEEAKRRAVTFLTDMFRVMDMQIEVHASFEDDTLSVDLSGEEMGLLIGKRGQTLDSLQYLTSLVVNKGKASYVRVKLDTEDYRNRRKATLENLAKNIAFKVKKTRRPVFLEPMNPYERRIIHSALQNDPYVTTHSEGEEPNRKVVVTPRRKNERGGNEGGRREYRRSDRSEYTRRKEQATPAGVAAEEPQQPEAEN